MEKMELANSRYFRRLSAILAWQCLGHTLLAAPASSPAFPFGDPGVMCAREPHTAGSCAGHGHDAQLAPGSLHHNIVSCMKVPGVPIT
eukprot:2919120-Amphidinium_carterae.2